MEYDLLATLKMTADGSEITRQLRFLSGGIQPLKVNVPVTVIYHDVATVKQPKLTFTGAIVKDGMPMIYITLSSGVEIRGSIPTQTMSNEDRERIFPGSFQGDIE